jgi:fucose 4-O-acetylase-like acetyltransferase
MNQRILVLFLAYFPLTAFAVTAGEISDMVTYIMGEISVLANVIAFMTGTAFCISALIKFQEYRRSPQYMPVSRPIMELIIGIILFALPFIFAATTDNALFGR